MDFVCNTSTEKEKKTTSKIKDLEDAKVRMEKVKYSIFRIYILYFGTYLMPNYFYFQPGQSERELNPYWKNGGSGLPPPKTLNSHKGFLKPKIDDDNDQDYNRRQESNHTKTSYGRQLWKKHDQKDDSRYDIRRRDYEERHKRHRENDKKEEKDKHHRDYREEGNKQYNTYDVERRGEKDKHYKKYDVERKEKNRCNNEYNHKEEYGSKYRKSDQPYKTVNKKNNEEKMEHNNEETKERQENIEKPLTDSELNTLAAKQIKAELMGNTVSMLKILHFTFNF